MVDALVAALIVYMLGLTLITLAAIGGALWLCWFVLNKTYVRSPSGNDVVVVPQEIAVPQRHIGPKTVPFSNRKLLEEAAEENDDSTEPQDASLYGFDNPFGIAVPLLGGPPVGYRDSNDAPEGK